MSKKLTGLIAGLVASLAFVVGTMQGCGGSSGGSDFKSLCNQGCDKAASCQGDADATTIAQFKMQCQASCNAQPTNCTNESARVSAAKACLAMSDCTAAGECALGIPPCQNGTGGTTGSGGGGGAGGTTGTGGTSGGAWTCMDQPGQGCTCIQDPSGNLTSCPSSYTCCFTATIQGIPTCNCTTPPTGVTCAQIAGAATGAVVGHCPQ